MDSGLIVCIRMKPAASLDFILSEVMTTKGSSAKVFNVVYFGMSEKMSSRWPHMALPHLGSVGSLYNRSTEAERWAPGWRDSSSKTRRPGFLVVDLQGLSA
jgi:hypothetical protein